MDVTPINGCVLIKLTSSYEFVATPDKKYDTKTSGIVIATEKEEYREWSDTYSSELVTTDTHKGIIGKKVYFEEYKDGTTIDFDGEKYALIKFEDIRGVSNA